MGLKTCEQLGDIDVERKSVRGVCVRNVKRREAQKKGQVFVLSSSDDGLNLF